MPHTANHTPLTIRQKKFVTEYMIDFHAGNAAIRAGYGKRSASSTASELLKLPKIHAEISRRTEKAVSGAGLSLQRILDEVALIINADPLDYFSDNYALKQLSDIPVEKRRLIESIRVFPHGGVIIKRASRIQALELAMKYFQHINCADGGLALGGDQAVNIQVNFVTAIGGASVLDARMGQPRNAA